MSDDDFDILAFCAFRYALGRSTYVTSAVAEIIVENKERIYPTTKKLMIKEINEAIEESRAGMRMDVREWQQVVIGLWEPDNAVA